MHTSTSTSPQELPLGRLRSAVDQILTRETERGMAVGSEPKVARRKVVCIATRVLAGHERAALARHLRHNDLDGFRAHAHHIAVRALGQHMRRAGAPKSSTQLERAVYVELIAGADLRDARHAFLGKEVAERLEHRRTPRPRGPRGARGGRGVEFRDGALTCTIDLPWLTDRAVPAA